VTLIVLEPASLGEVTQKDLFQWKSTFLHFDLIIEGTTEKA
jgi:hypothetical protein